MTTDSSFQGMSEENWQRFRGCPTASEVSAAIPTSSRSNEPQIFKGELL